MRPVLSGIDVLQSDPRPVLGTRRIALVTGSANTDSRGEPVWRVMQRLAGRRLRAIWSLQHGFMVDKQDNMVLSRSFRWGEAGLPVRSLYGGGRLPRPSWLDGIDVVVADVLDVGTRVYTFVNHLAMLLPWLSGRGVPLLVLDRPNPLNGVTLEGWTCRPDHFSIVGQLAAPMRHGLTAGEYLRLALCGSGAATELEIVPVANWRRGFHEGDWTYPSPNMPSFASALVYPGAVLLEGTNLSEGRGTCRPFELLGAPWLDHLALGRELSRLRLPGVRFVPLFFKPEFSKHAGRVCRGLLLQVTDRRRFRPYRTCYEALRLCRRLHPGRFAWKPPPYEFERLRLPIDMIAGGPELRLALEADRNWADVAPVIGRDIVSFRRRAASHLLYP